MVEVVATDEFVKWYDTAVKALEAAGVGLRFPRTSGIKGCRYAIRELRVQSGGKPFRIFYAFDPARNAVLILGGNKQGDDLFYEHMVPRVERIWEQYLAEQS